MIKIFIDQGHNPKNPNSGAEGNGLQEADLTYKIGIRLRDLLNSNPDFTSITSRNSPDEILGTSNATSLAARTNAANAWGADYFISLHANASEITTATGSEGYVYSLSSAAYPLAQSILKGLYNITGTVSRGVFARPTLYVLRKTAMPATLIEMGFITNPAEAAAMNNDPASYASGMYNGIVSYFGG
ncbi:MAG: N-acetylmuramoyl-L-alanine amidase [Clostridia bacterium]|nr:N-acetylmuramoyl-L-alanine amidase [Clostridia bacterium]